MPWLEQPQFNCFCNIANLLHYWKIVFSYRSSFAVPRVHKNRSFQFSRNRSFCMVHFWLTSKSIQSWRRKQLQRFKQILCALNFMWFFWARHKLWAFSLPVWFSDDVHFSLLEVVVQYWHVLPKAIQDSEPPRGDKHRAKDLLHFFHLTLLLDISSGHYTKNFIENKECFSLSILVVALSDLIVLRSKDLTQTSQWYLQFLLS